MTSPRKGRSVGVKKGEGDQSQENEEQNSDPRTATTSGKNRRKGMHLEENNVESDEGKKLKFSKIVTARTVGKPRRTVQKIR
ncbi:hypothetical protein V6N12_041702 [Hibiscus sabdariffa]|uniref:Uncharacterized protein n=1 Tax=Hibiscus sabdariffa TaxID=183260 RepID=A0ABR2AH66_9ROSI